MIILQLPNYSLIIRLINNRPLLYNIRISNNNYITHRIQISHYEYYSNCFSLALIR